jgi:hypothetical protein
MSNSLLLFVLSLTDGDGQLKAIPFLWDGSGGEGATARQVIEEKGADALVEDEKDDVLEQLPRLIKDMEICISSPWAFQEMPIVHEANCLPNVAIPFRLAEKCDEVEEKRPVTGMLHLYIGHDVGIHFDGYEALGTDGPDAEAVALELWNEELRILAWPIRTNEEPTIIDMEGARGQTR